VKYSILGALSQYPIAKSAWFLCLFRRLLCAIKDRRWSRSWHL